MSSAYFAPLVTLPTVITEPGEYVTRCGELITIHKASSRHCFGCHGVYQNGIVESWHHSGRILADRETANDIVRSAAA